MQLARLALVLPLAVALLLPAAGAAEEKFPEPESLRSAVAFWMRVYLEVTTDAGLLHDSTHPSVVYEVVRLDDVKGRRSRQRVIDARRRHWRGVLTYLSKDRPPRDEAERAIVQLYQIELGRAPGPRDWSRAARRIRFQLGQRDKFRAGIIRSGAYEVEMRDILREKGLPEDLAFLPHVESSFNLAAYSKYGAAGAWQFMRSTGRRYMKVDYVVDERLDALRSTRAAADLLRDNHDSLGNWPLAITAYNHGSTGMRRAVRKVGSDEIGEIVSRYRSRTFGFASRNFYAQFLAARRILQAYPSYFGPLRRDTPEVVDTVTLSFYADVNDVRSHLGVEPDVLKQLNPALRPPVFRATKRIPKGYTLRLPAGTIQPSLEAWLADYPQAKRYERQKRSTYYTVQRGDTLSRIAGRNRTSVSTLVALNSLPSRHRIYPGQVLLLPDGTRRAPPPQRGLVRSARAAPLPIAPEKIQPAPARPPQIDGSPWLRIDGDEILVDADETLGHLADWLALPTSRLRELNDMTRSRGLRMGQRLVLDFSKVSPELFLRRRIEYHKSIEEDFFGSYKVTGTTDHVLRRGDSLWLLSHRVYGVPAWLIHRYNPGVDLVSVRPGQKILIPVVEKD